MLFVRKGSTYAEISNKHKTAALPAHALGRNVLERQNMSFHLYRYDHTVMTHHKKMRESQLSRSPR